MYPHEWLISMVNVGKYTSPMDPMGLTHPKIKESNLKMMGTGKMIFRNSRRSVFKGEPAVHLPGLIVESR